MTRSTDLAVLSRVVEHRDALGVPVRLDRADKACDADRVREPIQEQGATPNIPFRSNRRWKPCFSKGLYARDLIERLFQAEHFRRIATRYDKLAADLLAIVQLASLRR